MPTFSGRTVALLESRRSSELASLVQRLGGVPACAPAVRERPCQVDAGPLIDRVIAGDFPIAIVLTGAGASTFFAEAERFDALNAVRRAMSDMTLVCRGPKPLAVLKKHGLRAAVATEKPHTTRELLEALSAIALEGSPVMLLHYGERNEHFAAAVRDLGAIVEEVCLYEWALPENVEPLRDLVRNAIAGRIDAMLFTSQIQFRFLLQIASEMGEAAALVDALNEQIVVGAVGPVCAGALREGGVEADVLPASPHSGPLVGAVADYFELTDSRPGA